MAEFWERICCSHENKICNKGVEQQPSKPTKLCRWCYWVGLYQQIYHFIINDYKSVVLYGFILFLFAVLHGKITSCPNTRNILFFWIFPDLLQVCNVVIYFGTGWFSSSLRTLDWRNFLNPFGEHELEIYFWTRTIENVGTHWNFNCSHGDPNTPDSDH